MSRVVVLPAQGILLAATDLRRLYPDAPDRYRPST
jgi:hypothetical protein